jgi:hypothetical protein
MIKPTQSQVVKALADLASSGTYKEITPAGARNMNAIFSLVAEVINELEASEKEAEAQLALTYNEAEQADQGDSDDNSNPF